MFQELPLEEKKRKKKQGHLITWQRPTNTELHILQTSPSSSFKGYLLVPDTRSHPSVHQSMFIASLASYNSTGSCALCESRTGMYFAPRPAPGNQAQVIEAERWWQPRPEVSSSELGLMLVVCQRQSSTNGRDSGLGSVTPQLCKWPHAKAEDMKTNDLICMPHLMLLRPWSKSGCVCASVFVCAYMCMCERVCVWGGLQHVCPPCETTTRLPSCQDSSDITPRKVFARCHFA